jgi:hypothetical protein
MLDSGPLGGFTVMKPTSALAMAFQDGALSRGCPSGCQTVRATHQPIEVPPAGVGVMAAGTVSFATSVAPPNISTARRFADNIEVQKSNANHQKK